MKVYVIFKDATNVWDLESNIYVSVCLTERAAEKEIEKLEKEDTENRYKYYHQEENLQE